MQRANLHQPAHGLIDTEIPAEHKSTVEHSYIIMEVLIIPTEKICTMEPNLFFPACSKCEVDCLLQQGIGIS